MGSSPITKGTRSGDVVTAVEQLAELWGQDLKDVEKQLASNLNEIGRQANTVS